MSVIKVSEQGMSAAGLARASLGASSSRGDETRARLTRTLSRAAGGGPQAEAAASEADDMAAEEGCGKVRGGRHDGRGAARVGRLSRRSLEPWEWELKLAWVGL